MKNLKFLALFVGLITVLTSVFSIPAFAGKNEVVTNLIIADEGEEVLNDTDWNITDSSIEKSGNTVVVSSDDATSSTKIIAKTIAKQCDDVEQIAVAKTNFKITALPEGEQLIFALGLVSIESGIGEEGNIEIAFTNDNGIKASARAIKDEKEVLLFSDKSCGVSLNGNSSIKMIITSSKELELYINDSLIGKFKLPVDGSGRFGILQTGSCGVVLSNCTYTCYIYETPENTNIFEDFEKGEFNSNLFVSSSTDYGVYPSGIKIEDYKGSKVLRFQNTRVAYFCTLHQYSNFEISFDIPYYNREYYYDEYGNLIGKPCSNMGIGFGEETCTPIGYAYTTDVDLVCFAPTVIRSELQKTYRVPIEELGITDLNTNDGYSVKLTVVDGHYDVAVKSLTQSEYKIVASSDYENQRSGYVNIWSTGCGDFAIDNLKITNLDKGANTIKVDYKSSKFDTKDYVPTAKENEKVFRPLSDDGKWWNIGGKYTVLDICLVGVAIVFCAFGAVFYGVNKKKKAEKSNEKE